MPQGRPPAGQRRAPKRQKPPARQTGFRPKAQSAIVKTPARPKDADFLLIGATDRTATTLMQANKRHFILQRQLLGITLLRKPAGLGEPPRTVKSSPPTILAAVNLAESEHKIGGLKIPSSLPASSYSGTPAPSPTSSSCFDSSSGASVNSRTVRRPP